MSLLILLLCITIQVFLTARKISPFISLLLVSIFAGLMLGMDSETLTKTIEKGVANTLGGLALIVCLGAVLGKILEESGAAEKIATTLIQAFGEKYIQWAVVITGVCIGIPLYYTAGFVILIPLIFSIARKTNTSYLYIGLPMAASLSVTHCFLPPHPGPVLLVKNFGADMGLTLIYGLIIAIPAIIIGGPFIGRFLKNIHSTPSLSKITDKESDKAQLPSVTISIIIALLPVFLIAVAVITTYFAPNTGLQRMTKLIGDPTIALLISVCIGLYFFGFKKQISIDQQMQWVSDGLSGVAMILLIITAGGIFKQVLTDSGTADYIAQYSKSWSMPPLIFAWLMTAILRISVGSATVAGVTAAGIVMPLLQSANVNAELMVLAIGAGSVFGSHVNDSGFWMFKEYFGLSIKDTFKSWTLMESIVSVVGLIGVIILDTII